MKVRICGIPHEVVEEIDNFDLDTHFGQINYGEAKIIINKNLDFKIKEETLCHEVIHGILVHIGRADLSNDETFVTAISNAIYQTFGLPKGE